MPEGGTIVAPGKKGSGARAIEAFSPTSLEVWLRRAFVFSFFALVDKLLDLYSLGVFVDYLKA